MEQQFSIFSGKGGSGKPELKAHYDEWGWINFLSSMAETKVFDLAGCGLDSVECVKNTKAYKVLTYASEKKDFDVAMKNAYEQK